MAGQFETKGDWAWGVARSHEELDDMDWEFWLSRTPKERLAATFQAAIDAWLLHDGESSQGIELSVCGVRRLGEVADDGV